jgi:peptidyl-prolyl cis-trans isomerase D
MLAFFRRQKWLWVILIGVFSLALIVSLVPMGQLDHVHITTDIAQVGSESVSASEFQTAYYNAVSNVGAGVTDEMLRAIGFENQVVDQLVNQAVMIAEAKRLGLNVAPSEVQQAVLDNPSFQENGVFIGLARYQQLLAANGLTVPDFENLIRRDILLAKLYSFVTSAATVSDASIETEYRYQNERAQFDFIVLDGPALETLVQVTEDDVQQYYEANVARYSIPEKRRARYVHIDTPTMAERVEVPEEDVVAYYQEHEQEYLNPPRVTAQHILFRTEDKTPEEIEEIRERARAVLERAKSGEDFSALAMEFSEDISASTGGDLGSFGLGQMVPEFEAAAFNLGPGATSDLVETAFGLHIIRVNERQEESLRPLEEVRLPIESVLKSQAAATEAADISQRIAVALVGDQDIDAVAATFGVEVRETGLVAQGEGFEGLAGTAELENRLFSMAENEVGTAIAVTDGYVVPQLLEIEAARTATFEEASGQVRSELISERAAELATEKAVEVKQMVDSGESLEAMAASLGLSIQTSPMVTRDGSVDAFGSTSALDNQIFTLDIGRIGQPVTVAGRTIVFSVRAREDIDQEAMRETFDQLRNDLLNAKRSQLFDSYGRQTRRRMEENGEIEIDDALVEEILSGTGHFI